MALNGAERQMPDHRDPDERKRGSAGGQETAPVPPMVSASGRAGGEYPICTGRPLEIRMRVATYGGSRYLLCKRSSAVFGQAWNRREFPLTSQGWEDCWRAYAQEDSEGARQYLYNSNQDAQRRKQVSASAARLANLDTMAVIPNCVLIGGYEQRPLVLSSSYSLHFTSTLLIITTASPTVVVAEIPLDDVTALRVDGPGAITTGGGFIGGGFGVEGAAEGMVVASVLNALTRRTSVDTILEVQDRERDFIFFHDVETPQQIRVKLMPVEAKLRSLARARERSTSADPLDRLERLAALHQAGALTAEEFQAAKASLLGSL